MLRAWSKRFEVTWSKHERLLCFGTSNKIRWLCVYRSKSLDCGDLQKPWSMYQMSDEREFLEPYTQFFTHLIPKNLMPTFGILISLGLQRARSITQLPCILEPLMIRVPTVIKFAVAILQCHLWSCRQAVDTSELMVGHHMVEGTVFRSSSHGQDHVHGIPKIRCSQCNSSWRFKFFGVVDLFPRTLLHHDLELLVCVTFHARVEDQQLVVQRVVTQCCNHRGCHRGCSQQSTRHLPMVSVQP